MRLPAPVTSWAHCAAGSRGQVDSSRRGGRVEAQESALAELHETVQRGFAEVTLALARLESRAAARVGD